MLSGILKVRIKLAADLAISVVGDTDCAGLSDASQPRCNVHPVAEDIALLDHNVADVDPDPHLHAHCFVFNATYDSEEQRWKAGEFSALKRDAPLYEAMFHARLARNGFEQWFRDESGAPAPWAIWKMDFIVLLLLYPIVFLWGVYAGTPILQNKLNLPFAVNLFIGNIFSVGLTGFLVPWAANRLTWWLQPAPGSEWRMSLLGAGMIMVLYAAMVFVFWRFF